MKQFTVRGIVPPFKRNEFWLRVDNGAELEEFFKVEKIDTKLTYAEGKPLICVREKFASCCKPGNHIRHTIEVYDRKDGRRIRGIGIKVL